MSAITPPSFIDDGLSFTKRVPHGLHPAHVATWIDATSSSTSAYTGSFVDDGADMLLPSRHAPGFGQINSDFYKQREREESEEGAWDNDVQRAVSGDVQRNLARMREVGEVEVKRERRRREGHDVVTMPAPIMWGAVVIKAEDGRVIVVDRNGEFDSGTGEGVNEQVGRWVKGDEIMETLSPTEVSTHRSSTHRSKGDSEHKSRKHGHSHRHKKSRHKHISPPLSKVLTPIPESVCESGYLASEGEDVMSPAGLFMTGGASGWPSRAATSVASPVSKAHNKSVRNSPGAARSKSPIRSPPGGWPSPALSLAKHSVASEQAWDRGDVEDDWKEDKSHRSHKSRKSHKSRMSEVHGFDKVSTKSVSTYKPPTVEDAPETSPERKDYVVSNWAGGGSGKGSEKAWSGSKKGSVGGWNANEQGSKRSSRAASQTGWGGSQKASEKSRKGSLKGGEDNQWTGNPVPDADWNNNPAPDNDNWNTSDKQSETGWDGFEKIKTLSEVSVAGSDSDRSSLTSRAPSRHSANMSTHRSSRHGSQSGWSGSKASRGSWASRKGRVDDDG